MKVAVVGTGYVGLISGVCLASVGHEVQAVDTNPDIVEKLNKAEPTIFENGLSEKLKQVVANGSFKATSDLKTALSNSDLVLVAVGTPTVDGQIDLKYISQVAKEIGIFLRDSPKHLSVVVKSTVIPGTTDTEVRQIIEKYSGKQVGDFGLGMNPEFLREGEAIKDFMNPDRIVIGHEDIETRHKLEELYAPWVVKKIYVNTRTAEMIKYSNNAILAAQISIANELANFASAVGGIDYMDVLDGVLSDGRWLPSESPENNSIGIHSYLYPGPGFGGSCFPKDVKALVSRGKELDQPMALLGAVLDVNERQPEQVRELLERSGIDPSSQRILLLGLSFKPGTDDVRESASLAIFDSLCRLTENLKLHDPVASINFSKERPQSLEYLVKDWKKEIEWSDVIVVATKWPEYKEIVKMPLVGKVLIDPRRYFKASDLPGAKYLAVGRRELD